MHKNMEAQKPHCSKTDSNMKTKKEGSFFDNERWGKHKVVTQNWLRYQRSKQNAEWSNQRKNNPSPDDPTTSNEKPKEIKKPLKASVRTGSPTSTRSGVKFTLPQESSRRTELSYMDRIRRFCKRPVCVVIILMLVYIIVPCSLICVMTYFLIEWRSKKKSMYRGKPYG